MSTMECEFLEDDMKTCVICGSYKSINTRYHTKIFTLCRECKEIFNNNVSNKISTSDNYNCFKKKFFHFRKSYTDNEQYDKDIEKILVDSLEKTIIDVKHNAPFSNIVIMNSDGGFYTYTSKDKINRWLMKDLIKQIDDETYIFTHDVKQRYPWELRQDLKKENKCICCGSETFLKKINILPQDFKTNIPPEYKDIIVVHFIFAVCVECKDFCISVRYTMNDHYIDKYGVSFFSHLTSVIDSGDNVKISDLIKEYVSIYNTKIK
jgi:hypothetical protein